MSRKHTRRKVYALTNPITLAIAGAAVTDTASLDRLRMLELTALESFRMGRATKSDWKALADVLNIAQTMAESGIGQEVLGVCARAQEALSETHDRFKRTGRLGFSGPELQALRELLEYHDLQRTSVSRSQYERSIKRTADRIRSAAPEVRVLID